MSELASVATFGTTLQYGTVDVAAATALAGIKAIVGLPQLSYDKYDKSRIDQADVIKRWAMGMADAGVLQLRIGFDKTLLATIIGLAGADHSWLITFIDGSKLACGCGAIQSWQFIASTNDEVVLDISIQMSRALVFTAGS